MSYVCREHTRPCGLQRVKSIVKLGLSSLLFLKSRSIRAAKTRHSGTFLAAYFCVEQLHKGATILSVIRLELVCQKRSE
ncbi:hypothetical protein SHPE106448_19995 [Shewanella pealeana]